MKSDTVLLTKNHLEKESERFENDEWNQIYDGVIKQAICQFPTNGYKIGVYTKAVLINTLYHAGVMAIVRLAHHIVKMNIDPKLRVADLSVVKDIRSGHGIKPAKGKRRDIDFYSFATKYVHFHKPHSYPMFDNLVMRLLSEANKNMEFHSRFKQDDLWDYSKYKSVVDSLAKHLRISDWGYKKIDQGLWNIADRRYR